MWNYERMLQYFSGPEASELLAAGKWGLEKESQRVKPTGDLALTDHPAAFGDKLIHPRITTDFAESQLELITPPLDSIQGAHDSLIAIHDEVEAGLGEELLWPLSMPPRLPTEDLIRVASFNDSDEGREKEAYRHELAARYGKKMQMISGLHVNFSFPDELLVAFGKHAGIPGSDREIKDELYFAVTRNFLRYRWLLIYLFGASPSIDPSYDSILCDELAVIEACCPACCSKTSQYERYATSMRVSRFGYSNTQRKTQMVSFNSMAEYLATFRKQLGKTFKKESEFYSSIRLKPHPADSGESQLDALQRRGVNYLELRIMDLDPYQREGIGVHSLFFIHLFLLYCLFEPSPPISAKEFEVINENHHMVSLFGRKPGLKLRKADDRTVKLQVWAEEILGKIERIAPLLHPEKDSIYRAVLNKEKRKVRDPSLIPSAVMQSEMAERNETFVQFGIRRAEENRRLQPVGRD